jgi:hypothetical protein
MQNRAQNPTSVFVVIYKWREEKVWSFCHIAQFLLSGAIRTAVERKQHCKAPSQWLQLGSGVYRKDQCSKMLGTQFVALGRS